MKRIGARGHPCLTPDVATKDLPDWGCILAWLAFMTVEMNSTGSPNFPRTLPIKECGTEPKALLMSSRATKGECLVVVVWWRKDRR